ncbi:response regulator CheY [Flammeovirgaceae bacterium 311]|nr:response regulator CheY [Flammeovirgaceae bacterium 311]
MEILLVEDDEYCVDFFKRSLLKQERFILLHHVTTAEDARTYLDSKERPGDICLIVLDIQLPRASGFDLLQYVKGNPQTCSIPVVMFTSSSERRDIDLSYQMGANSYLVKPIDYPGFSAAIQQLDVYWLRMNQV